MTKHCLFNWFVFPRRAELTIWRADKGVRVRYHNTFRIDPLVLLRAQCITPIHAMSFLLVIFDL